MDHRRSDEVIPRAQSPAGRAVNVPLLLLAAAVALAGVLFANPAAAASTTGVYSAQPVYLFGIPVDFILFGLTLLGVAVFHQKTLEVALTGLVAVTLYKLLFTGFRQGESLTGLMLQLHHEWVILANLFLLLMGFAILSRHFEKSQIPDAMPAFLPNGWSGSLVLLATVFVMSGFLDNIAAALIGGTMARHVFKGKVHIGYLAAIVAAANAGGAGSVVGDTTTTMMWIDGISPLRVVEAYVAAVAGFLIYGIPASLVQHRYSPISKDAQRGLHIEWTYVGVVAAILTIAIVANVIANLKFPTVLDAIPVIGLAVWIVILATAPLRRPDWAIMPETLKGTVFLLALVTNASFMPVEELPGASWQTALGLGFLSSVFDNIPLTTLALKQGGYDWGFLAYTVGFGGSMIWFGSSAGVAISNMYPEAKSVGLWLRHGWFVAVSYIVGFFVMFAIVGWTPDAPHKKRVALDMNYQLSAAGHLEGQPSADRTSAIGTKRTSRSRPGMSAVGGKADIDCRLTRSVPSPNRSPDFPRICMPSGADLCRFWTRHAPGIVQ
jgi:Na+/H+ antiporter NhaD/arsenite permease-like protein